jgi:hypothetical protein
MDISQYTTFDQPVPYKKLLIYPATVKDYIQFEYYAQCLSLDKNSTPDIKIISMNYLEYLFYSTATNPESQPYLMWLDRLLALCLKDEESFENIEKSVLRYNFDNPHSPFFTINDIKYDANDFDQIKEIICEQNLVDVPDETVSKEVRDAYEEARKHKTKLKGEKPASLEDYIIGIAGATGWTYDFIYNMTIRKFKKALRRIDYYIHYKIYLSASMSGFVEFKDKSVLRHWLSGFEEKDDYKDVSIALEEIQGKVSFENAKK